MFFSLFLVLPLVVLMHFAIDIQHFIILDFWHSSLIILQIQDLIRVHFYFATKEQGYNLYSFIYYYNFFGKPDDPLKLNH